MADQKTYRAVVPLEPGADLTTARWLVRESFEQTAAAAGLVIVDYRDDTMVPADQISVANAKHLDHPIDFYEWHEFVAVAERPAPVPTDPVCGYCAHPPHAAGECTGSIPDWQLPEGADPQPCDCLGVAGLK